jgi:hypothetical protein
MEGEQKMKWKTIFLANATIALIAGWIVLLTYKDITQAIVLFGISITAIGFYRLLKDTND